MSVGGRITLIQAVLSNLSVYNVSLFKCPMLVLNRLEKLQRNFLWQGNEPKIKFHLVDWKSVCKPRNKEGLGIKPLVHMKRAPLGKWLWKLARKGAIYGLRWSLQNTSSPEDGILEYRFSGV